MEGCGGFGRREWYMEEEGKTATSEKEGKAFGLVRKEKQEDEDPRREPARRWGEQAGRCGEDGGSAASSWTCREKERTETETEAGNAERDGFFQCLAASACICLVLLVLSLSPFVFSPWAAVRLRVLSVQSVLSARSSSHSMDAGCGWFQWH